MFVFVLCVNLKKQTTDIPCFRIIRITLLESINLMTHTDTIAEIRWTLLFWVNWQLVQCSTQFCDGF